MNLYAYVSGNPINMMDLDGLHEVDYPFTHTHDPVQEYKDGKPIYARTNPFTNHVTYYPLFDKLDKCVQPSVDYHEYEHSKYLITYEKDVWAKEIEWIKKRLSEMTECDPCRNILENWLKANEAQWKQEYK